MLSQFRTPITVNMKGELIGRDDMGLDVYGPARDVTFMGEFQPLKTDEKASFQQGTGTVVTLYKVWLPPEAHKVTAQETLTIRGRKWRIMGELEPHNIAGRVHHFQCLVKHS